MKNEGSITLSKAYNTLITNFKDGEMAVIPEKEFMFTFKNYHEHQGDTNEHK
jgi:hypothetical protein